MKNKTDYNADFLLKKALHSSETPDARLMRRVKYALQSKKEEPVLRKQTIRRSFGAAVAVAAVMLVTATAFAAWHFLSPSDVAETVGDRDLSAAFTGESAININASVSSGDYVFTLLAVASGKDITDMPHYSDGVLQGDRTYAVLAIQNADGTPVDKDDPPLFFASPLVKGLKPWEVNVITMHGDYSEFVTDGTLYRIVACDNVTMFADRGLYFGVAAGVFCNNQTFAFDEQTGEIAVNPDFDGASAVFDLPIDASSADPAKAAQYLAGLHAPAESDGAAEASPRADAGTGETRFILDE
jgi:hypothetical protein